MGVVPAVGPMAIVSRARGVPPAPLARRSSRPAEVGPLILWRDATNNLTFLYTAANWPSASWYLEVYMRSVSAKALARLYDVTAAAEVASSEILDDMALDGLTTYARARSSGLTLVDGHEYQVQFGVQDGGGGGVLGAKLIAVSSGVTHSFVSAVAEGGDATVVRPSNWNAVHANTLLESHIPLLTVVLEVTF